MTVTEQSAVELVAALEAEIAELTTRAKSLQTEIECRRSAGQFKGLADMDIERETIEGQIRAARARLAPARQVADVERMEQSAAASRLSRARAVLADIPAQFATA